MADTAPEATSARGSAAATGHARRGGGRGGAGRGGRRRPTGAAASGRPDESKPPAKKKTAKGKDDAAPLTSSSPPVVDAEAARPKALTPVESLVEAIRINDMDAFRAVLAANAETLNVNTQRTRDGDAALVEACRYARREMLSLLLQGKQLAHASDVNTASMNKKANRLGLTPLIAACMTLDTTIVDVLLAQEASSSVNVVQMYGRVNAFVVCALFSVANGHTEEQAQRAVTIFQKLLTYAKEKNKLQDVFTFETEKGNRLVHIVAGLSNWQGVELLRSFGADFECINRLGKSPLRMVEYNAFERRSFAFCEPSQPDAKKKKNKKRKNGKQGGNGDSATDVDDKNEPVILAEPESEADRKAEIPLLTRTYVELSKAVGFVHLANEFADASDERTPFLIDGLVYTLVSLYPTVLKRPKEYREVWENALRIKPPASATAGATSANDDQLLVESTTLTPVAFKLLMEHLLSNYSLSRRVKTMGMVLMQLFLPYAGVSPLSHDSAPPLDQLSGVTFYRSITQTLYRSGTKLLFCIFDRTDIEEDESYDEEIEFHLLIALTELFLQFFTPYAHTIQDKSSSTAAARGNVTAMFQNAIEPVKKLWPLVQAALHGLDDAISTPQRFSLLMHIIQVFEQLEASFLADEARTLTKLYKIMKQFVKKEATKKRIDNYISSQVNLLQTIANSFPLPSSFLDKVLPEKNKLDILLRSDPKILGLDLYALAPLDDVIRLEHKVDYLGALAEEQSGSVSISISRASASNYVDFILQQVLSTNVRSLKGELNITLINEPGVGIGVIREFFQIVQKCFLNPNYSGDDSAADLENQALPSHVTEIGSQWLQLARSQSPARSEDSRERSHKKEPEASESSISDLVKLFPLFEYVDKEKKHDEVCITARKLRVKKSVIEAKKSENQLSLSQADVMVNQAEVNALKKLYQCVGRLMGLAIRNHQPLDVNFPLPLWKFILLEKVSWEEYCGSNEVFKRSLQFVLDHDFDSSPLEMYFECTTDVTIADDSNIEKVNGKQVSELTTTMDMQLPQKGGLAHTAVTNVNKHEYVELRARQFFFGNELEYYKKLREGLLDTIYRTDLKLFRPKELQRLVRGEREIDFATMKKSMLYSKGASPDHGVIQRFWEVVDEFDQTQREKLLTFWSGSPQPPLFGFASNHRSMNSDTALWYIDVDARMKANQLPMANTCDRRLILPDYPSKDVVKQKLLTALEHGAVGYDRM
uniref:HECT-type E3 ubiquitin transferase n=1 Tax=Globisporangium ultimum (strain ATCC 200006 / CBS 805.95 / DAOM BR144) TaxID=431595 RepID=K3WMM9_GLOUD